MPAPTFTSPPDAPSRSNPPATYISRFNAWLAWMAAFATELISGVSWFSDQTVAVAADAATASSSAATASAAASAAVNAPGTTGSSATSLALTAGAKSFTMNTGKTLVAGQALSLASAADPANRMVVVLSTYDSGTGEATGTALAGQISGSGGPYDDWIIGMAALANIAGRQAIWIPAGAMASRVTNGPAVGVFETTTNKVNRRTYDFDAATIEYAQFAIQMPKSWDEGTVTFAPVWSHASTTTNFKTSWGLQAVAFANDDALDAAFGTAQFSNDTGGTTDDIYIGPESAAITVAGSPAAEEVCWFQVFRKADDATNDTLAVDARLVGMTVFINTSAENDA